MNTQTIAEQVAELARAQEGQPEPPAMQVFADERARLRVRDLPAGIARPGTPLPDAELVTATGEPARLRDQLAGAPGVVVLYRGVWCPFCNLALATYQHQLLPALTERGARLVAISPQRPDGSLSMQEKHDLSFPVLSDPGNQVAGALGVTTVADAEVLAAQAELGLDLTQVNADGTATMPMPTTVVVDEAGVIRWIDVHPDYSSRSEVAAILAALDEMLGSTGGAAGRAAG
jgi:peroxiredoxin